MNLSLNFDNFSTHLKLFTKCIPFTDSIYRLMFASKYMRNDDMMLLS